MENKLIEWTMDDVMSELKRISLVSEPAIEEEFLLFSNDLLNFKTIDDEKRVITGPAMRPDIKIPRRDGNGDLYWGFFSKDTVRKAAELFFRNGSNVNMTNLEHELEVPGVYVFESWIVENPELDKAKALAFTDVREGDWFVSMKVENDSVWKHYLKTGVLKGFSVEIKAQEKEVDIYSKITDILMSGLNDDDAYEAIKRLFDAKN